MDGKVRDDGIRLLPVIQIALLALTIAFAFATPLMSTARAATTYDVSIVDFAFQPSTISIQPGDSVKWTNNGAVDHTSTSDVGSTESWNSGTLVPGASYTHTFTLTGSNGYHCAIHTYMTATVTVGAIPEFSSLAFVMIGLLVLVVGLSAFSRRR